MFKINTKKMKKSIKKKVATPKVVMVLNEGFGNRCSICGGFFDDGICNNHHERGKTYPKEKK